MIVALICGRKDKVRFPGRNTFPLLGRPLMVYPILAASNAREVTRVYLSTDDENMASIGGHHGCGLIDRPEELRAADVSLERVIAHGQEEIVQREGATPDFLVVLLANAPTVTAEMIDQGVALLRGDPSVDAVASVTLRNEFSPLYAMRLNEKGLLQPCLAPPPGDLAEGVYFPDALMWILRAGSFFKGQKQTVRKNEVINPAVQRVLPLMHEGYGDIDYDWQIPAAEDWLRRHGFDEDHTPYKSVPAPRSADDRRAFEIHRPGDPAWRALVSTAPFCDADREPLALLERAGMTVVLNPLGRRLTEEELKELIGDFGFLIAGTEPISERVIDAAVHLRLIARVGIGLDNVDLMAARRRGVAVSYTPEAPGPAVAELTVGLILSLLRHIGRADRQMRNGVWNRFQGRRLNGAKVGVVGVGRIGRSVIRHLKGGFPEVEILANDPVKDEAFGRTFGVSWVDKTALFASADIVTLHVPLTRETRGMVDDAVLATMKPGAVLVNTSRGGIVHEKDLAASLRAGRLAGAAVDVFDREPYHGELTAIDRCLLTCHMGSMTVDCRTRMEREATEDVVRFLKGEPLKFPVPAEEYDRAGIESQRKDGKPS